MPNAPAMVGVVTAGAQLEGAQRETDDDFTDGPTAAEEVRSSISAILCNASCRVVVIFRYLSAWKNKHLPAEERAARAAWGQAVATVGAIAGTKLTGGAEPALASQDSATERA